MKAYLSGYKKEMLKQVLFFLRLNITMPRISGMKKISVVWARQMLL